MRRTSALLHRQGWLAFAWALLACGAPAGPPGDDAATTTGSGSGSGSGSTTASTSDGASSDPTPATSSSSTAADEATEGPPACTVGSHDCPRGEGCTQPTFYDPPYCTPIPEGGCTEVSGCPDGLMCQPGSHHSEIGECVPIEAGSDGSSSDDGSSGTSTGSTSSG